MRDSPGAAAPGGWVNSADRPDFHKLVLELEDAVARLSEEKRSRDTPIARHEKEQGILARGVAGPGRRLGLNSRHGARPPSASTGRRAFAHRASGPHVLDHFPETRPACGGGLTRGA